MNVVDTDEVVLDGGIRRYCRWMQLQMDVVVTSDVYMYLQMDVSSNKRDRSYCRWA